MQLGSFQPTDPKCERCGQPVVHNFVFQDNAFWHYSCLREGHDQLFKAEHIARSLNLALFVHESQQPA